MDKKLQTLDSIQRIINRIMCKVLDHKFSFVVNEYKGAPYLQVIFIAKNYQSEELEIQYCRKFSLQYTMCDSEVIRTAYKALEAALVHELQEAFTYRNARIFDPHLDLNALVEFVKGAPQDVRVQVEEKSNV